MGCLESKETEYLLCRECHTNLGDMTKESKIKSCPECESEEVGKGRKVEEICPQCHSLRIQNIEEKRRSIAQQLRAAIKQLHYGHTKIREFNNALTAAKRLLYSLRMANFLHYKWLEDNIESLQEETVALKNRVMNQAEIVAKRIAAETKGLIDYTRWTTEQFPFIEGVTNRVMQIGERYKRNVDDALQTARAALEDITKQLEGLDYYRKRFAGFYEVTELAVNELPVCALPDIRIAGSDFLRNVKANGILYITNRRIVFIAEIGLMRKKMEVIFDFPLMYLTSIEEDGRFRKRLILRMKQGDIKIACNEQTQKVLPDYVEIGRRFERYQQTDLQRVRKIEQTDTNMSDVRIKIETLVHSLLSSDRHRIETTHTPRESIPYESYQKYDGAYPQSVRQPYEYPSRQYDHPSMNIRRIDYPRGVNAYQRGDLHALQQDAMELEKAITETKEMFRAGRIVPEDFIRRYRVLMRDAYVTQQEIRKLQRGSREPDWMY